MKQFQTLVAVALITLLTSCATNKTASNLTNTNPQDGSGDKILGSTSFPGGQPTNGDPFNVTEVSTDGTYGFKESNAVKVGGANENKGPLNERKFLNALAGPNGEQIQYVRVGSCCPFSTKNGLMGQGMLDKYKITWAGQTQPVFLYINMYDYETLKIPVGFTFKK